METKPLKNSQYIKRNAPFNTSPLFWGLLVAFCLAASVTAYLTFVVVRDAVLALPFQIGQSAPIPQGASGNPPGTPNPLETPIAQLPSLDLPGGPTPQPWDGASRVNILFMGLDYGDWSEDREGPSRTDTMILFTIDPLTKTAGWIHIPRDLWVNIPGFNYGKINTAYYLGEAYQLPGGGPGLAIKTVEQFLGVPINYYAQVDFQAFEKFIDEIGGIDIDVPMMYDENGEPLKVFKIDPIGKHNTIKLEPGKRYHFDGPAALAYARNRYSSGGDFDRAERQKQVIFAIRDKILKLNMLPTLIEKSPLLYAELASGVHTNMELEEGISLAWLAVQIPDENIKQGVIAPPEMVEMGVSVDGLDILIPIPDKIRILRDEIFTAAGPVSPAAAIGNPKDLMLAEAARVSVLNGTYTAGLASRTQQYLINQGVNVVFTGNAQDFYTYTTIIDYTGKPYTVQYLVDLMSIQPTRIYSSYDPNSEVDVAVLLGSDWPGNVVLP